ncbi:hypothetical protein EVAR_51220_1 [Eumeta japonica]|uniref:Uncharacterized protein n=1 Tax=Eumeta variegata TaxID=151549 RepID=A0A4C1Z8G6_EUMVA|nr:hypothetical protein EVAR_51220_1 [Eumeta japonica]
MGRRSGRRPPTGTQVYNTAKARRSEFGRAMDATLSERILTVEMVKSVYSCDQLDETETPLMEFRVRGVEKGCAYQEAAHPERSPKQTGIRGRGICLGQRGLRKGSVRGADRELEAVLLSTRWGEPVGQHLQGHQGNGEKTGRMSYFKPTRDKYYV